MNKLFGHLKTVHKHRKEVRKLCFKCGLYRQGLVHDLSKYSPAEFIPSVKYFTGNRSPIENQINATGYSEVWLHHKGRNKHHYEYWQDFTHGENGIMVEMPLKYVAEMFCDRVAACKTYLKDKYTDGSAYEYFEENFKMSDVHPETYIYISSWLYSLYVDGEEKTCREIKRLVKLRKYKERGI